jgi:hypothetical protein
MFSRLATLLPIAALIAVTAAAPNAIDTRDGGSNCSTSDQYCCPTNQLAVRHLFPFHCPWMIHPSIVFQDGENYDFTSAAGGGLISGTGVNAGLTCTPITLLALSSGADCTQQAVCCTNNGLVSLHHALV